MKLGICRRFFLGSDVDILLNKHKGGKANNSDFKMKQDYPAIYELFPNRRNFNKRSRKLQFKIDQISIELAEELTKEEHTYIIDSTPSPICRTVRASKLRIMRDDIDFQPAYGYQAIDKTRYYRFKLHLLVSNAGTIKTTC